jgi:23S rRNA pseudouridine2605 synthase
MDRINKFLAHAGLGSRRDCEDLIRAGRVSINGIAVQDLSTRVSPDHKVTVDGKLIHSERMVYWLVNKPRGYLCTNHDPAGRPRAIDLVTHIDERVYTVGRLDEDSEGLLLLTNDGDLANKLMHPRYGVRKTYLVQVAGNPTPDDLEQIRKGIWLSEGSVKADNVKRLKRQGESVWLRIVLSEGKNREIRRMLAKLEHKVMRLKRVAIANIDIGTLRSGKSRPLSATELQNLKRLAEKAATKPTKEEKPAPAK